MERDCIGKEMYNGLQCVRRRMKRRRRMKGR